MYRLVTWSTFDALVQSYRSRSGRRGQFVFKVPRSSVHNAPYNYESEPLFIQFEPETGLDGPWPGAFASRSDLVQ